MIIRKAKLDDSEEIVKVQIAAWKTTYQGIIPDDYLDSMVWEDRVSIWKRLISSQIVYVAENQYNHLVGFCNVGEGSKEEYPDFEGELYAFYILKEYQRNEIGKELFNRAIEDLKDIGICSLIVKVLEENQFKYFYESLGAEQIDAIEIVFSEKKLSELVYSWKNITDITE